MTKIAMTPEKPKASPVHDEAANTEGVAVPGADTKPAAPAAPNS